MALSIKNPEVERLARELAAKTGESITHAVLVALRDRMDREDQDRKRDLKVARLLEIGREGRRLPTFDDRSLEEIIGYDEHGLPT